MKLYLCYILIFIITPVNFMVHAQQFPELPGQINGWSLTEQIQINTREALFDYIDGGAELYLSYGFRSALSCRYSREGNPEVTAEIFDLGSAQNAFGLYSQTRDKDETEYGQGSYYVSGAQFFWKGRYWISLITGETTEESLKLLYSLAAIIDEKISETGERPDILSVLPAEGLVPGGYLYFHHYIWLNSYYFIASDNILGIDENTPAVLAKYGPPAERLYFLAIQYNDTARALKAFTSFGEHYFPEGLTDDCIKLEDKTWLAARLHGSILVGIFNGTGREKTLELLGRAGNQLK